MSPAARAVRGGAADCRVHTIIAHRITQGYSVGAFAGSVIVLRSPGGALADGSLPCLGVGKFPTKIFCYQCFVRICGAQSEGLLISLL